MLRERLAKEKGNLEALEELARRLSKEANPSYGSHLRKLAPHIPQAASLEDWLLGLGEEDLRRLRKATGTPHLPAAVKAAQRILLREREEERLRGLGFREALATIMRARGLTVADLARLAGLSKVTLRAWLQGRRPSSLLRVRRLEEALGLEPGILEGKVSLSESRFVPIAKEVLGDTPWKRRKILSALRQMARERYGLPLADLTQEEAEALLSEYRTRPTTIRRERAAVATALPYALPLERWPERLRREWDLYASLCERGKGGHLGTAAAAAVLAGHVLPRAVRTTSLKREQQELERFFGFLSRTDPSRAQALSMELLLEVGLVQEYLRWRASRFAGTGLPVWTRSEESFLALLRKLTNPERGFLRQLPALKGEAEPPDWAARVQGAWEAYGNLIRRLGPVLHAEPGYRAVEPILEAEDPVGVLIRGLGNMLAELGARVGDPLNPVWPQGKAALRNALALYRDLVVWWTMLVHPLRAKHFYTATLENLQREGGELALVWKKSDFKNARGSTFAHMDDEDTLAFPLGPDPSLSWKGGKVGLGEAWEVYLQEVRPRLGGEALFPRLESMKALTSMFYERSNTYILPVAPKGTLPFGPHSLRHIVATGVVKTTGSLEHAANILLDDIKTVQKHYARFLPRDRYTKSWQAFWQRRGA